MEEIVNTLINSKDKIKFVKEASDKKVKFDMSNKHYMCNTTVVMWKYNYILYKEIHILFMTFRYLLMILLNIWTIFPSNET